ncbi:MAG: hypothetical protein QW683_07450 [Candidatus Caldarchaeum sp.]
MTYRYLLRYVKNRKSQRITVEAWPRRKELATPPELRKPSFIIGKLNGQRTELTIYLIKELTHKYGAQKTKTGFVIRFPETIEAIADAYRVGLALAILSEASTEEEAENALRYVERSAPEEIWFWTSKLLGIIKTDASPNKVIRALAILAS